MTSPLALLDINFIKSLIDPNDDRSKDANRAYHRAIEVCWRIVWNDRRLLKHYKPVLRGAYYQWDEKKNELEGKKKLVKVASSQVEARPLSEQEEKEIRQADPKDLLLFELARGAGANYIVTLEPRLTRVTGIKGIQVIDLFTFKKLLEFIE